MGSGGELNIIQAELANYVRVREGEVEGGIKVNTTRGL